MAWYDSLRVSILYTKTLDGTSFIEGPKQPIGPITVNHGTISNAATIQFPEEIEIRTATGFAIYGTLDCEPIATGRLFCLRPVSPGVTVLFNPGTLAAGNTLICEPHECVACGVNGIRIALCELHLALFYHENKDMLSTLCTDRFDSELEEKLVLDWAHNEQRRLDKLTL